MANGNKAACTPGLQPQNHCPVWADAGDHGPPWPPGLRKSQIRQCSAAVGLGAGRLSGLAGVRPEAGQRGGALLPCPSLRSLGCQRVTAAPRPGSLKGSVHTHSSKRLGTTVSDASVSLAALRSTSYPVPAGPTRSVQGTDLPRAGGGGRPTAVGNFWICGRASPDDVVGKGRELWGPTAEDGKKVGLGLQLMGLDTESVKLQLAPLGALNVDGLLASWNVGCSARGALRQGGSLQLGRCGRRTHSVKGWVPAPLHAAASRESTINCRRDTHDPRAARADGTPGRAQRLHFRASGLRRTAALFLCGGKQVCLAPWKVAAADAGKSDPIFKCSAGVCPLKEVYDEYLG
uniref:Uncharacterized protein n=1 Tax=Rangifer tarandus platyrhynchus TaxID=3082113 RepID=A0ACB0FH42_RANTA|nr:unnamed protein product [Rangifer tarandus platyrhynchus]